MAEVKVRPASGGNRDIAVPPPPPRPNSFMGATETVIEAQQADFLARVQASVQGTIRRHEAS